jgi:hypothetical protein
MKWYERDPIRFEMERQLLRRFYPDVKLLQKRGSMYIHKTVRGRKNTYTVELTYPEKFPWSPLTSRMLTPKLPMSPHQYSPGMLCLYEPGDAGPETTGKVFCDWVVQWVYHYERWLRGISWPTKSGG